MTPTVGGQFGHNGGDVHNMLVSDELGDLSDRISTFEDKPRNGSATVNMPDVQNGGGFQGDNYIDSQLLEHERSAHNQQASHSSHLNKNASFDHQSRDFQSEVSATVQPGNSKLQKQIVPEIVKQHDDEGHKADEDEVCEEVADLHPKKRARPRKLPILSDEMAKLGRTRGDEKKKKKLDREGMDKPAKRPWTRAASSKLTPAAPSHMKVTRSIELAQEQNGVRGTHVRRGRNIGHRMTLKSLQPGQGYVAIPSQTVDISEYEVHY